MSNKVTTMKPNQTIYWRRCRREWGGGATTPCTGKCRTRHQPLTPTNLQTLFAACCVHVPPITIWHRLIASPRRLSVSKRQER